MNGTIRRVYGTKHWNVKKEQFALHLIIIWFDKNCWKSFLNKVANTWKTSYQSNKLNQRIKSNRIDVNKNIEYVVTKNANFIDFNGEKCVW